MARFDGPVRTPNHDKIVLSDGVVTSEENSEGGAVSVPEMILDAADAIRLAAWLARFHAEHNAQEVKKNG